jgi:nucleotide-binding universal stress UspA family protein
MKILFCSDGMSPAEDAVRFGAPIAAALQAETSLLGITEKPSHEEAHVRALQRQRRILEEHGLNAELIAKAGRPLPEIVKRTRETHYDLVVIGGGRKARIGPWWLSDRAYRIIESVEPPVLVVIGRRPALRRMLLTTSGGTQAQPAVEFAGQIARSVNARVTLLHVLPEPPPIYAGLIEQEKDPERLLASNSRLGLTLRQQHELILQRGVSCEFRLREGLVVAEVLAELAQGDYDMVVAGSTPAGDKLRQYVMGGITREIVNRAELPVLVVRGAPKAGWRRFRDLAAGWLSAPKARSTAAGV